MKREAHEIMLRILLVVVLALSALVFVLGGYAIVLKEENRKFELVIEEIRTSVMPGIVEGPLPIDYPVELPGRAEVPREFLSVPDTHNFFLETFNYRKLIVNSFDFLSEGTAFGFVVVEENTAFKLCVEKGQGNYFITRIADRYGVMFLGENPLTGLYDSKTAYGIQLVSHTISDGIAPQVVDLRSEGYPACVYKSVTADGRTFFAAVLGIFPDATSARDFSNSIDVQQLQRITGWNITDRFVRQLR
jgi:hypothetical protein